MPNKQSHKLNNVTSLDKKSGSLAYNRFEMQISQTIHMAIELYSNLNYLLVLDHYDDITLFDDDVTPETVSYYQMKTSEDSISINTAISEEWVAKLYEQLNNSQWMIKELGLITNCPPKVSVKFKSEDGKTHSEERKYTASATSRGFPMRPIGVSCASAAIVCASKQAHIWVSITPGATQFTVMPLGATSFASAFAIPINAALLAE